MKKIFLLILLLACLYFKSNAQFNKKWLVSGGGQVSVYNQKLVYKASNGSYTTNGNQTNIGFGIEAGRFILKNLSVSYKYTYLLWDDNTGNKWRVNLNRNEILINKLFPIKNDLFFNLGISPFYQKATTKENNLSAFETISHGCVFYVGFNFQIDRASLVSVNYFRIIDNLPATIFSKPGIELSYKYIFNEKK